MLEKIQSEIRELIAEILEMDPKEIKPEAHFVRDLGADSMSALEVMATLEKKYQIVIEPENLPEMITLQQITNLVGRLLYGR